MKASNDTSDREIVITRVLNAPREKVFAAWTDPARISKWWGPRGFTTTTFEMNPTPGGIWRFIMHGPDGTDYKNKIDYIEVVKPERLVYQHGDDGEDAQKPFHVTITFVEQAGKTTLTMRSVFATPEEFEMVKKFGAVEGGNQTVDRLEELLAQDGR